MVNKIISKLNLYKVVFFVLIFLGIFLRFWHIEFGLPHSFYADEPEFSEFAIKYTFEFKDVVLNNNWYKVMPVSYVYGTFPSYLLTVFTIIFTKILSVTNVNYDKTVLFIFLRVINSLFSIILIPVVYFVYKYLFKDKTGSLLVSILVALNWKLIIHAHYVNADIFLTVLIALSFLSTIKYFQSTKDKDISLYTWLTGLFFGLSVSTKITSLITLPLYWYLFLNRKDYRGFFAFNFVILLIFMLTNPFSIIFANSFVSRIYEMSIKEAGLVFDSVDLSPLKYFVGMQWMLTLPIFLAFLLGVYRVFREKDKKDLHIFLLSNFLVYFIFYSLQTRRVDRWLLPVLPIALVYSSVGLMHLKKLLLDNKQTAKRLVGYLILFVVLIYNLFFTYTLFNQFQRYTPKSYAYLWMKDNTTIDNPLIKTLVYTEEGLDPLNKLPNADVSQYEVYEGKGASLFFPKDPYLYKYIILSSRPMENFKRIPVKGKYPYYSQKWEEFEKTVTSGGDFTLIKSFETTTPNLIPLSNVYIYENTKTYLSSYYK